jgi:phage-related holin
MPYYFGPPEPRDLYTDTIQVMVDAVVHTLDNVTTALPLKMLMAGVLAWATDALSMNAELFMIYLGFATGDLVFAVAYAVKTHSFRPYYLGRWGFKLATHLVILVIIGYTVRALFLTVGAMAPAVNYCLLIFIITEVVSVIDSLVRLGLPIDGFFLVLFKKMRYGFIKKLEHQLGADNDFNVSDSGGDDIGDTEEVRPPLYDGLPVDRHSDGDSSVLPVGDGTGQRPAQDDQDGTGSLSREERHSEPADGQLGRVDPDVAAARGTP